MLHYPEHTTVRSDLKIQTCSHPQATDLGTVRYINSVGAEKLAPQHDTPFAVIAHAVSIVTHKEDAGCNDRTFVGVAVEVEMPLPRFRVL